MTKCVCDTQLFAKWLIIMGIINEIGHHIMRPFVCNNKSTYYSSCLANMYVSDKNNGQVYHFVNVDYYYN